MRAQSLQKMEEQDDEDDDDDSDDEYGEYGDDEEEDLDDSIEPTGGNKDYLQKYRIGPKEEAKKTPTKLKVDIATAKEESKSSPLNSNSGTKASTSPLK